MRNLGGIIIIDFIDMNNEDHRRRVLHSLEQALSKDRVKTSINGFSQLGAVEMTVNAPVKAWSMCFATSAQPATDVER